MKIYGLVIDQDGRCIHYHSKLDIVANKCSICHKYWACYECHNQLSNHNFGPYNPNFISVLCGHCQQRFTYKDYELIRSCSSCLQAFNPKCSLHKGIYTTQKNPA